MSNSIQATAGNAAGPRETGLRATKAVCRDRGVSDTTFWRWGKRGWIRLVNISGKSYVDLQSLAEFDRRASAGEFARPPAGAAWKAAAARAAKKTAESAAQDEERGHP